MNDTCAAEAQRSLGSATAPQRLTCVLQDEPHPGLPRGSSRHPVLGTTGLLGHHTGQGLNPTAADTEQGMAWTWTAPQLRFHQPPPPRGHSPTRLRGDSPGGAQAGLSGDGGGCLERGVTPSHRLGRPLLLSRDAYHPKSSSLWHLGWSEAHVSFGGKKASLHLSVLRAVAAAVTSSPRESRAALFPSLWPRVRVASAWGGSGLCSKGERGSGKSHSGS